MKYINPPNIKRFPLGSVAQTAVEAALRVRSKLSSIDDIQSVRVETYSPGMSEDPDRWDPQTRETADHSMPYCVAIALRYGPPQIQYFSPEYFRDPKTLELMQKIRVDVTEEARRARPEASPGTVEVVTKSGARFKERVLYQRGHHKDPMVDEELEAKFRSLAQGVLSSRQTGLLLTGCGTWSRSMISARSSSC